MTDDITIGVRVPPALMDEYRRLAEERDCSVGDLIRQAMAAYRPPPTYARRAGVLLIPSDGPAGPSDGYSSDQLIAAFASSGTDHDLTPTVIPVPGRYIQSVRCVGERIVIPAKMALDPATDLDALRQAGDVRVDSAEGWPLDEYIRLRTASRLPATQDHTAETRIDL